jgi:hypothetical protein
MPTDRNPRPLHLLWFAALWLGGVGADCARPAVLDHSEMNATRPDKTDNELAAVSHPPTGMVCSPIWGMLRASRNVL